MIILIIVIGLFLIIHEEANKNVLFLTKERQEQLKIMKPLVDKDRQLREDLFSVKYTKYK